MEKWASLTWDDLEEWAGSRSVSRGRSYREEGRVQKLAISNKGRLLATVEGGDRYVVSVWLEFEEAEDAAIESECTLSRRREWLQARGGGRRRILGAAGAQPESPSCQPGGSALGQNWKA